jgi:hypothetical protein
VVEWKDRTGEVAAEAELSNMVKGASEGDFASRLSTEGKDPFFATLGRLFNELVETVSKVASREAVASEEAVTMASVVEVKSRMAVNAVVVPAEAEDSEDPKEAVPAEKVVANPAITPRSMRTCFSTGTRPVSRTRERRPRCLRRKSSTVSSKSTSSVSLLGLLQLNKSHEAGCLVCVYVFNRLEYGNPSEGKIAFSNSHKIVGESVLSEEVKIIQVYYYCSLNSQTTKITLRSINSQTLFLPIIQKFRKFNIEELIHYLQIYQMLYS